MQNPFTEAELKPSPALKLMTLLSIIASALFIVFAVYGFIFAESSYQNALKLIESPNYNDSPAFVKSLFNREYLSFLEKSVQERVPLCIIGVLTSTLCLIGAIQMRKLKKQGYVLWLTGELIPLCTNYLYFGLYTFKGIIGVLGIVVIGVFVAFYTMNRKKFVLG